MSAIDDKHIVIMGGDNRVALKDVIIFNAETGKSRKAAQSNQETILCMAQSVCV